jgi:hypothetical protein
MAKEIKMQTTQGELKAIAKAIGASLKRAGNPVPHSNLLHAVSAALNQRDWHTLKANLECAASADVPETKVRDTKRKPAVKTLVGPEVKAEFWTDDRVFEATFDARAFMMQASDEQLAAILEVGFVGDARTDAVALYAGEVGKNEDIAEAFAYLSAMQKACTKNPPGFECEVDRDSYLQWMNEQRPPVLANLLCAREGVVVRRFKEAENENGDWGWERLEADEVTDESTSYFADRQAAELDAYSALGLLQMALDGLL